MKAYDGKVGLMVSGLECATVTDCDSRKHGVRAVMCLSEGIMGGKAILLLTLHVGEDVGCKQRCLAAKSIDFLIVCWPHWRDSFIQRNQMLIIQRSSSTAIP